MGIRHNIDLRRLQDDVIKAAEIVAVPYDKDRIWKVLTAYKDHFSGASVSFVTSTKPKEKRALSIRYVDVQVPHNPYSIALTEDLLIKEGHLIDDLFSEIQSKYPIMGHGIDVDVAYGLAKIWSFFQVPQPMEKAYAMPSIPKTIEKNANYFSKYGLNLFHLFALDYRNKNFNLYFMVKEPGLFPPDKVAGMIKDLGFEVPTQEVLDYCSDALTIYYTFRWDSPRIERVCFGNTRLKPNQAPTHLHPLIERYTTQAPFLEKRRFIFGFTFTPSGMYIKIENDYSGSMIDLMERGAQAEIWLDEMKRQSSEEVRQGTESEKKLEWHPEVYDLFEKFTAGIPEAFRTIVKPLLHETAEKKCQEKNGSQVTETHLITALFEITPKPFQGEAINNLKSLGIEVNLSDYGIDPTEIEAQAAAVPPLKWEDGLVEAFSAFKEAVSEKIGANVIELVIQTAKELVTEDSEEKGDTTSGKQPLITSVYIVEAVLNEAGEEKKFALKKLKKLGFDVDAGKKQAKKRAEAITWPKDIEDLFLRIISHSGRLTRRLAKRSVSKGARRIALKRRSREISRMDVIRANLSETPGAFRKTMLNGLQLEGITEEEIKEAEQINSET